MWAMVTIKGPPSSPTTSSTVGELMSKSPSLAEWAEIVALNVTLPLVNKTSAECNQWPMVSFSFSLHSAREHDFGRDNQWPMISLFLSFSFFLPLSQFFPFSFNKTLPEFSQ